MQISLLSKFRVQAKDYRFRPVYFDNYDNGLKYAQERKSYHNEYSIHFLNNQTGDWELQICTFETQKEELKEKKKLLIKYDQKPLYKELKTLFTTDQLLKHFPQIFPKTKYVLIRETNEYVFKILKENNIKEKYFEYVHKIIETCFLCTLHPYHKTNPDILTLQEIETLTK